LNLLSLLKTLILSTMNRMGYTIVKLRIAHQGEPEATSAIPVKSPAPIEANKPEFNPAPKSTELRPYRIHMHHIGGRGGGFPFPMDRRFFDGTETYIYEADPACKRQMEIKSPDVDHVIVAAVTGENAAGSFHINYDPYTSSLLPPNPANREIFFQDASCDYILEDVLKPAKTIPIVGETIDTLAQKHGFPVDYLSLDVQGAEYDLLAGMSSETSRDTVAIMCEISFFQFYDSQRLFDEIMTLLRQKGFFMAHLFPHGYDWATYRTGIGWRATGFTAHGDVLFFREPASIRAHARDPFCALLKAAFIALCRGNVSYALKCLEEAYRTPSSDLLAAAGEIGYIRFLDDMYRLYQSEPHLYPPRFSHLWTEEESLARFDVSSPNLIPDKAKIRQTYFTETDEAMFRRVAPRLLDASPTGFETMLRNNGFMPLADEVAEKRIVSIKQLLGALGMDVRNGSVCIV